MRSYRLSLAVKYRILFGTAVALIIGAALYVPWYLMELLVAEQAFREAQRLADAHFRLVMPSGLQAGRPVGSIHMRETSLLSEDVGTEPRFVQLTASLDDPDSVLIDGQRDPFVRMAFREFLADPQRRWVYENETEKGHRWFLYAHAVRVSKSCLTCHGEGSPRTFTENQLAGLVEVRLPTDRLATVSTWNLIWLIASGGLAGILAILVFHIITHRFILAPIHGLRRVAIHVAEGNLDERADVHTGDEFEQLSNSLNNMLERLRGSQEDLRKANKLLDEKLGQMAETNVALYESNRLKSEFLANVTHELRTPLTSIIGFAELLREGPASLANPRTARYAENILISGRILLEIINDLLDLAKIEAGKVDLQLETVHLEEICSTLTDFIVPQAEKHHLRVSLEMEPELPMLISDRGKIRQILFNLLSNAVKFTPENGQITVRARRDGGSHVRLEVSDTGPGISAEHRTIIFEKFRQIDASATREHRGTGLGLAIAQELTRLLGGEIGVESEVDVGSTFWVRLPIVTTEGNDPDAGVSE